MVDELEGPEQGDNAEWCLLRIILWHHRPQDPGDQARLAEVECGCGRWNRGRINKIKDEISNNNAKRKSPAEHPWSWVTSPWKLERRAPYRGLWWRPRHDSEEMKMPVKNLACGHMYDKASIERCHSRAERRLTLHSSRVSRQEVSMEWPGSRRPREPSRRGSLNRTSLT